MSRAVGILENGGKTERFHAVGRVGRWMRDGWRLFRRAPLRLFGVLLAMLAVEGLIQFTVPGVGIILSKWVLALIAGVLWVALARLDEFGALQPLQALAACRGRFGGLAALATISLLAFAVQLGAAWLVAGPDAVSLLLLMTPASLARHEIVLILVAGIPVSTLIMFVAPRLLIDRENFAEALVNGPRVVLRHIVPVSLLMAVMSLAVALALMTYMLSFLLVGPWLICVSYAAYRDIAQADADTRVFSR